MHASGDAALLQALIQNLISNAWKSSATVAGAEIEFGRLPDGPRQTYFVRDNGVGFDMQFKDQLFKAFHRLHGDEIFAGAVDGGATCYFSLATVPASGT